ncbi:MAG TPA: helix-turn-helix transcriptional regulator [Puia sp.]|jgi:transcriptional regulator with XRE-family HTH domain|nr:helix-turn-helix transcriptional regulator [Puia sp.]
MDKKQDALRKLGRRLTELRHRQNLTLEQLSTSSGISIQELTAIEAGETDPALTTVFHICRGLGLSPNELLPPG